MCADPVPHWTDVSLTFSLSSFRFGPVPPSLRKRKYIRKCVKRGSRFSHFIPFFKGHRFSSFIFHLFSTFSISFLSNFILFVLALALCLLFPARGKREEGKGWIETTRLVNRSEGSDTSSSRGRERACAVFSRSVLCVLRRHLFIQFDFVAREEPALLHLLLTATATLHNSQKAQTHIPKRKFV